MKQSCPRLYLYTFISLQNFKFTRKRIRLVKMDIFLNPDFPEAPVHLGTPIGQQHKVAQRVCCTRRTEHMDLRPERNTHDRRVSSCPRARTQTRTCLPPRPPPTVAHAPLPPPSDNCARTPVLKMADIMPCHCK